MIIGDQLIDGVNIYRIKGTRNKFFVKKGNNVYYVRDNKWRVCHLTDSQLSNLEYWRYTRYASKCFAKIKDTFFTFILHNFAS